MAEHPLTKQIFFILRMKSVEVAARPASTTAHHVFLILKTIITRYYLTFIILAAAETAATTIVERNHQSFEYGRCRSCE